jgi:hypothetical protein
VKKNKLHNIKSTGFTTPNDYFESFEDKLLYRIKSEEIKESVEKTGFTVPKDYFIAVENSILSKVSTSDKPIVKLNTRQTFYYIAGIAASLVLMFAIFINNGTNEELTIEMVETYLEERNLDSYELAQLLSDVDLLEEDFTIINTPYEEDNLEYYLLESTDVESYLD